VPIEWSSPKFSAISVVLADTIINLRSKDPFIPLFFVMIYSTVLFSYSARLG